MQLPGELRNMIWEFSIPTDRILVVSGHGYCVHALPPPAIAWVCRESRALALRHGRAYALFDVFDPFQAYTSGLRPGMEAWTWFSPAFDRVLLALMDDPPERATPREGLAALALDVRHMLVQTDCFYPGTTRVFLPDALLQGHVYRVLACFPNARSVGVVRACFNIAPGRDGEEGQTGAPRPPLYYYRPLRDQLLEETDPRIRLLSNPAHIRAVEEAKVQRMAPCTCHCDDSGRDVGTDQHAEEDDDGGDGDGEEDEKPHLWQPPPKQPQFNPRRRHHEYDHGLAGLWFPSSPHDGPWELWRVMKMWVKAQDHMTPLAGADPTLVYRNTTKLPAERRTWIAGIAGQSPHVYFAEMVFYGNGYIAASAMPRCVVTAARRGRGGTGRCGLLGGNNKLGMKIVMKI